MKNTPQLPMISVQEAVQALDTAPLDFEPDPSETVAGGYAEVCSNVCPANLEVRQELKGWGCRVIGAGCLSLCGSQGGRPDNGAYARINYAHENASATVVAICLPKK